MYLCVCVYVCERDHRQNSLCIHVYFILFVATANHACALFRIITMSAPPPYDPSQKAGYYPPAQAPYPPVEAYPPSAQPSVPPQVSL